MSRCHPYPPPGYEKKAFVEPPLSPKKEKLKHKDKKRKRRKDKETNGDLKPHDKDKRSKQNHLSGHVEGMPNLANGVHSEGKLKLINGNVARAEAVNAHATQMLQAIRTKGRTLSNDVEDPHKKRLEINGMVDQTPFMSAAFQASTSGNGAGITDHQVRPPSSIVVSEIGDELNRKRRVEFMPHVEQVWSAVDDQEWLFLCDNQRQIRLKAMEMAESAPQAVTNAIFLPLVEIYALPYVILD